MGVRFGNPFAASLGDRQQDIPEVSHAIRCAPVGGTRSLPYPIA